MLPKTGLCSWVEIINSTMFKALKNKMKYIFAILKYLEYVCYSSISTMQDHPLYMVKCTKLLPAWSCSPYHVFQVPTSSQGYSGSA